MASQALRYYDVFILHDADCEVDDGLLCVVLAAVQVRGCDGRPRLSLPLTLQRSLPALRNTVKALLPALSRKPCPVKRNASGLVYAFICNYTCLPTDSILLTATLSHLATQSETYQGQKHTHVSTCVAFSDCWTTAEAENALKSGTFRVAVLANGLSKLREYACCKAGVAFSKDHSELPLMQVRGALEVFPFVMRDALVNMLWMEMS